MLYLDITTATEYKTHISERRSAHPDMSDTFYHGPGYPNEQQPVDIGLHDSDLSTP